MLGVFKPVSSFFVSIVQDATSAASEFYSEEKEVSDLSLAKMYAVALRVFGIIGSVKAAVSIGTAILNPPLSIAYLVSDIFGLVMLLEFIKIGSNVSKQVDNYKALPKDYEGKRSRPIGSVLDGTFPDGHLQIFEGTFILKNLFSFGCVLKQMVVKA